MKQLIKKRKLRGLICLLVCVFGIFLIYDRFVKAEKVENICRPQFVISQQSNTLDATIAPSLDSTCKGKNVVTTPARALQELAKANVVYLGETHDRNRDRQLQLEIIEALQKRNSQIAIAMEMFQIPYQGAIDRYLAGKLSERELIEETEYNQRWGYAWESYAPIFRFAKEKQLPVVALNTPSEITRQVAKKGLDSLTPQQQKIIPPASEIDTGNDAYRQMLTKFFQQHQHSNHGNSSSFDRFFLAQVLWDETMASKIADFVKANPKYRVVAIAGQGHIVYGYGIPSRVVRRMKGRQFLQFSVLLSSPKDAANSEQPISDYIWQ